MRLYIIRHGETLWNTQGRLQGRADIELNENGIRLAKITGENLKDVPFDLAFTSPLKRAKETAKLVLGERKISLIEDQRIQEVSFGEWEGLCCRGENCQVPADRFPKFFKNAFCYTPPEGGETVEQVIERTNDFYQELLHTSEYQDKTILIALHGCSSRALLCNILGKENDFWRGKVPPNCAVSIIDVVDGRSSVVELDKVYYDKKDIVDYYSSSKS